MDKELKKLVFYGTGDEAYELFCMGCKFYHYLEGTPKHWREQVLRMLKSMCKASRRDYKEWYGDPDAPDADKVTGDRCTG